jgi:hypothetical protein
LSEHLAIYNISWKLVEKLVPVLVKWVLENNNEGAGVVNNQSAIEKQGKYLPTKADVELAASQVPIGVQGNIDAILDKIEHNVLTAGKILQDKWRMDTERNIAIWFNSTLASISPEATSRRFVVFGRRHQLKPAFSCV